MALRELKAKVTSELYERVGGRITDSTLSEADLQPINASLAAPGSAGASASPDQPSAATQSPIAPAPAQVAPPTGVTPPPVRPPTR